MNEKKQCIINTYIIFIKETYYHLQLFRMNSINFFNTGLQIGSSCFRYTYKHYTDKRDYIIQKVSVCGETN